MFQINVRAKLGKMAGQSYVLNIVLKLLNFKLINYFKQSDAIVIECLQKGQSILLFFI